MKEILALSNVDAHDLYQSDPYSGDRHLAAQFLHKRADALIDREEHLLDEVIRKWDGERTVQIRDAIQQGLRFGDLLAARIEPQIRFLQDQVKDVENGMLAARNSGFPAPVIEAEIEQSRQKLIALKEEQRQLGQELARARRQYREGVNALGGRISACGSVRSAWSALGKN